MRILLYIGLMIFCLSANAQQEFHITQFAYNKAVFNPSFVNAGNHPEITGLFRSQWAGIEGAPESYLMLAQMPFREKNIGIGFSIQRTTIGIQEKLDLNGMYAYQLNLGSYSASLGLQAGVRSFNNDFTDDRLIAIDGIGPDPVIQEVRISKTIFNVGLGARLEGHNSYFAVSSPRLIKSSIDFEETGFIGRELRHIYFMAGGIYRLNDIWQFQPMILYKYAEKSPADTDIFTSFIYREQVHMGVNFRTGGSPNTLLESLDLILGLNIDRRIFASLSFDFTFTELRSFENGSFELMINYRFTEDKPVLETHNPRLF